MFYSYYYSLFYMCSYYNFIFRLRNHSIKNSISEMFYNNVKIKKKLVVTQYRGCTAMT